MARQTLPSLLGAAAVCVFLVACDSDSDPMGSDSQSAGETEVDDDETGETAPVDPSGTSGTPNPSTTTDEPGSGGTTGPTDTDTDTGETDPTVSFIEDPDGGGIVVECDVWTEDCPEGEKCMPWANDGGNSWNATRCSPIDGNPGQVGDMCTVEGSGVSGVDSCDARSMCYYVDSEVGEGICVGFCDGTPQAPTCDADFICTIVNDGVLTLCRPECDPLQQNCEGSAACLPASGSEGFTCIVDASGEGGSLGEPCEFINACDPGLYCAGAEVVPGCVSASCCTEFCDLESDDCSDAESECIPWFAEGATPPGLEDVGACGLPA